jgi:hypothetical protein
MPFLYKYCGLILPKKNIINFYFQKKKKQILLYQPLKAAESRTGDNNAIPYKYRVQSDFIGKQYCLFVSTRSRSPPVTKSKALVVLAIPLPIANNDMAST